MNCVLGDANILAIRKRKTGWLAMNAFADNVQKIRTKRALSQRALAEKLKVSKSTVGNWETSVSMPDFEGLGNVARVLGVTVSDLFKEDLDVDALVPYVEVPVFGEIAAGDPIEMDECDFAFPAPYQMAKMHPNAFFLKIEGESMNRKLPNGCYALVDPDLKDPIVNNCVYAVCVNGYSATAKRVRSLANGIELMPDSDDPTYKPKLFDYGESDTETVTVIGKVVWYTVPFDFEI